MPLGHSAVWLMIQQIIAASNLTKIKGYLVLFPKLKYLKEGVIH